MYSFIFESLTLIMLPFTITNHITRREYVHFVITQNYRRFPIIILTLCGLFSIVFIIMDAFDSPVAGSANSNTHWFWASTVILLPLLLWWKAVRMYNSMPAIHAVAEYTFDDNGVEFKTKDEQSRYSWNNVTKVKEKGNFILLYKSNIGAEFIRTERLSLEEKLFLLSKNKKQ